MGRKVGEHGLVATGEAGRLKRIEQRVRGAAAVSVGALAIIPPPFPFTAFVLASGALRANAWSFSLTLAGVRLLRFMVEGALAAHYGRGILAWMKSPTFTIVISALIGLAVIGTVISGIAVYRSTKRGPGETTRERRSRRSHGSSRHEPVVQGPVQNSETQERRDAVCTRRAARDLR